MSQLSQSPKTTELLSTMQPPNDQFINDLAQNMLAMTYPIQYIYNNKDIVAMWTFIISSFISFSSLPYKKDGFSPFFLVFFFQKLLLFYKFLKEFNSQIAENDRHELEILFDVLIVLFLFADISIVAFEKSHYKGPRGPLLLIH